MSFPMPRFMAKMRNSIQGKENKEKTQGVVPKCMANERGDVGNQTRNSSQYGDSNQKFITISEI